MRLAYSLSTLSISSTASHIMVRADLVGLRPRCVEGDSVPTGAFSSSAIVVSRAMAVTTGAVGGRNWVFVVAVVVAMRLVRRDRSIHEKRRFSYLQDACIKGCDFRRVDLCGETRSRHSYSTRSSRDTLNSSYRVQR
ncbi:hypothetical protein LXA43DRAFT_980311 [Ganoderma leucocontextum]|nr:hypothetical protein LXA43DRAFT_980311 [Ganoderma leucocontextum]